MPVVRSMDIVKLAKERAIRGNRKLDISEDM